MDKLDSITELYRSHRQQLYAHACELLGEREAARDAVNDVFCALLERPDRLIDGRNALAYCYVMVKNRCIDLLRRRSVEQKNGPAVAEAFASWGIDDYREREHEIALLQQTIRNMPPQMRSVAEAYFLDDDTAAEIGRKMRLSENTVRTHIARAMKLLRRKFL